MCGIAGYLGHCDDVSAAAVQRMNDRQRHRGPDAEGIWTSPLEAGVGAVLGHRRLSIIDTSTDGTQPMRDEPSGNVIVFNGEIYNFRSLRDDLASHGLACRTRTDTEVILKAYARWGEGCVEKLRGMFAFAIWDAQKQRVFLARDRLGIKPLYYARVKREGRGEALIFASELRAILATDLVARRLHPVGVATYLWNGFVIGPGTIARDVELLPPGTAALVNPRDPRINPRRFWQIPGDAEARRSHGGPARGEDVGDRLREAVAQHLVSDVPLGVFLSGGVDSSAIANLAVRGSTGRIKTFNVSFDESDLDEAPHARAVARALDTEHAELHLTGADLLARLPEALNAIDQPTFDGINTYFVSRATRDAGVTVALAGTGGDEVFGGYRSFIDVPRARKMSAVWGRLPGKRPVRLFARYRRRGGFPPQTRWGKLDDVLGTRGSLLDVYQVAYAMFTAEFTSELSLGADGSNTAYGLPLPVHRELDALVDGRTDLAAVSALELSCFISERLLRDTDAASMAASLEVRVPLLDHVVIETAFATPDRLRFGRPLTKQLLRDFGLCDLDPALFNRPKAGFVLPIDRWARTDMRATMSETLLDKTLCKNAGVSPEAVARLWSAFLGNMPGIYWTRPWALFVLLSWCRDHRMVLS